MICGAPCTARSYRKWARVKISGFGASLCGGGLCWGARRRDRSLLAVGFHGLNSREFLDRNLVFLHMHLIMYMSVDDRYLKQDVRSYHACTAFSRAYTHVCAHSMLVSHGQHGLLNPTCHIA